MDFSVTLSGVPGGTDASNDSPTPAQLTEDNTSLVPVDTAMEGVDGVATGNTYGNISSKNEIDRMAFVE